MKRLHMALVAIALVMLGGYLVSAQQAPAAQAPAAPPAPIPAGLPEWAYTPPVPLPPGAKPPAPNPPAPDDGTVHRVPGSSVGLTITQIRGAIPLPIPDWWPEEHGPMPDIVRVGKTGVRACGFCHLAN